MLTLVPIVVLRIDFGSIPFPGKTFPGIIHFPEKRSGKPGKWVIPENVFPGNGIEPLISYGFVLL